MQAVSPGCMLEDQHIQAVSESMCMCAWAQDPVDKSPAVLVHRYSITHQRRSQILLSERNEVLQR